MKTQFDWKTSRAAFMTFKKFLFLESESLHFCDDQNKEVTRKKMAGLVELTQKSFVSHAQLVAFCKKFGNIGRAAVSAHMQGYKNAGIIKIFFEGTDKFYLLNDANEFGKLFKGKADFFLLIIAASDNFNTFIKLLEDSEIEYAEF